MRRALRVIPAASPGDASGLVRVDLGGDQTRICQRLGANHGMEARRGGGCGATTHALARRLDEAVPTVFAALPGVPDVPMPPSDQFSEVLTALDRYRETSPQMVVFGTLIRDALPIHPFGSPPS